VPQGYSAPVSQGWTGAGELAQWPQRALGFLLDAVIPAVAFFVIYIVALILGHVVGILGILFLLVAYVGVFAYEIIQLIKQGNTGQTIGKKVIGLKVIKEQTGEPIGAGMSIVRQIAHFADSVVCYLGWLFPLWDAKRQTFADKIVTSVVIVVPKQPFNPTDLYTTT